MKLLIFPPVDPEREEAIRRAAAAMLVVNAADEFIARKHMVDADAFFGKLTPELLAVAQQLRWVQSPTASLEHYLFPELISHSCQLSNMRGLFSDVIADHVMMFVLCFARNTHLYLRKQAEHDWAPIGGEYSRPSFSAGPGVVSDIVRQHQHLPDLTMGIVGVGAIGAEIARRAAAFSMTIIGVDPCCRSVDGVIDEVWRVDQLPTLLAQSDYVVIAAPHTPATEGMFRSPQFSLMKSSSRLINIGRGAIVNLADLTRALRTEQIAGAALDVFEIEPLPPEHPLWAMQNVILTPHIAAASPRIAERHTALLLENVGRFSRGEEPLNLVHKEHWF